MSVFIDRKYLKLLSPKLNRFSQKKEDLFNFRCPFCGDSQKHLHKARGYVYRKKNDYFYKCQNCGVGHTMYNFINLLDVNMVKEYAMERYTNGETGNQNYQKPEKKELKFETPVFKKRKEIDLPKIIDLPMDHYAAQYCIGRKIPEATYNTLYYANDFKKFIDELLPDHGKELKEDDPRLIIPFYDLDGTLLAVQGRSLRDSKIRYITIKLAEESIKIFGLDRVNKEEKVYVTEGPIDSLFLPNAVATADANLANAVNYIPREKLVLVFDNEPRNKDICKLMDKAIENHFAICIWPEMMQEKDINDMILTGFTSDEIVDIINKNTFVNLRAKMEFIQWKKV
jgi:transcription elongation factor Elf1